MRMVTNVLFSSVLCCYSLRLPLRLPHLNSPTEDENQLFTDRFVAVTQKKRADGASKVLAFSRIFGDQNEVQPSADKMPITKYSKRELTSTFVKNDHEWNKGNGPMLKIPGWMSATPLFLSDVMFLPKENSLVVFGLGERAGSTVDDVTLAQNIKHHSQEIGNLTVSFLDIDHDAELKCAVLEPRVRDGNCVGGSHKLLCRIKGLNLEDVLNELQKKGKTTIAVKLNGEIAEISTKSLSAAGVSITPRMYKASLEKEREEGKKDSAKKITISVAWAVHSQVPPFVEETIQYYKQAGISHIYVGAFNERERGSWLKALQPSIQDGYASFMDMDSWGDEFDFRVKNDNTTGKPVAPLVLWKTVINDWALYNAKNHDDLLMISDYDELIVPNRPMPIPDVIADQLQIVHPNQLGNFCFIRLCPFLTSYDPQAPPVWKSRATDFPYMDGGDPKHEHADGEDFCKQGGYADLYPKSISVTRTIYQTTVHEPGSCSIATDNIGNFVQWERLPASASTPTILLQHFDAFKNRYDGYVKTHMPSTFTKVWGPRLHI